MFPPLRFQISTSPFGFETFLLNYYQACSVVNLQKCVTGGSVKSNRALAVESALKIYLSSRDHDKAYKERRLSIRFHLPNMGMKQLVQAKTSYDEDIAILYEKITKCQEAVQKLKRDRTPETAMAEFGVHTGRHTDMIDRFKNIMEMHKQAKKWIMRERGIYLWEIRQRRVKAAKVPILKLQLTLNLKEAQTLLNELRSCCSRLSPCMRLTYKNTAKFTF